MIGSKARKLPNSMDQSQEMQSFGQTAIPAAKYRELHDDQSRGMNQNDSKVGQELALSDALGENLSNKFTAHKSPRAVATEKKSHVHAEFIFHKHVNTSF
ncbi:hypothetical protein J7T55_006611 [Diaporthe amygdali]|uniref:uncharacterized protein n=1 Tax=Phomopsis amygdali TaxID=1214568 RepID=UPI0022FF004F|nr:uncharacterized protein J7T55_006611 [Diaporthe amygdali]KAJ0125266.1 hypothetical protein J7T55_006611 [Diaporthe amygdali]